jgi:hypothetical protein
VKRIVFAVILIVSVQLAAQTSSIAAPSSNPRVRAITAFVRLDRETYRQQIAEALVVLRKAKADFESAGYEVETLQPCLQCSFHLCFHFAAKRFVPYKPAIQTAHQNRD